MTGLKKTGIPILIMLFGAASPAPASALKTIRILLPNAPSASPGERDLSSLIDEYNLKRKPPAGATIQLIRRGDHFSSLRDFMALYLAGDTPEIAAIETSEHKAIEQTHLARPIPKEFLNRIGLPVPSGSTYLPFQYSMPILVATQEIPLPSTWDGVVRLAANLAVTAPDLLPLALPLQGPRGLWIFESLVGKPLWTRETGGLRANRNLEKSIQMLQRHPGDLSWDRALQDFLERKTPLLVTSLDALPLISQKASFRWKAGPLPSLGPSSRGPLISGSDLIVTVDDPQIWQFLSFLYSKEAAARWMISGGLLPLLPEWKSTPEWKKAPESYRVLAQSVKRPQAGRTTDQDVVRAHSEWISALRHLFGETSKRLPTETVFTQLDSNLTLK